MVDFDELKGRLVGGAFKVMQTRQFVHLFQDHRVLGVIAEGLSVRARGRRALRAVGGGVARALGLATLDDLNDLERQIRATGGASGEPRAID